METLRLKPRPPAPAAELENWDDEDFLIDDDLTFRSGGSNATSYVNRRDSQSSFRSERESLQGEEKCLQIPDDDEKATMDAIAAAANAGIPLPQNITPSALMGGTIKRLGGRKIKKIIQEDWDDDLELPEPGQALRIKPQDSSRFPDVLRQVSSTQTSPVKTTRPSAVTALQPNPKSRAGNVLSSSVNLDKYRDNENEDDDFFGDGGATIKVPKTRPPKPVSMITPPTPRKNEGEDDVEFGLELPSDGKLKLSTRRDIPKTSPLSTIEDFDWGEGSLGTRFGGTRRDGRSNRSSSVSALSPSIASSLTAESEDEAMDGLVLPEGPLDFTERLKKRRQSTSPERPVELPQLPPEATASLPTPTPRAEADREDFLSGLEIGNGEVYDSGKLTLHRNIKLKDARSASPTRPKTAVSITFTNKPMATSTSRLPRPMMGHERTHTSTSLEPVSESGGPILPRTQRSQSRIGHSAQSSITSVHTPTTPSHGQLLPPATPRRKDVGQKTPGMSLRDGPTTTNAQLLRLKRSLPVMKAAQSPAARPLASRGYERPPSRTDGHGRPGSSHMRPKTPVERARAGHESAAAQARKNPVPFLAGGSIQSQSHHITSKSARTLRRQDSDVTVDLRPSSRAVSRSTVRSPSPSKRFRAAERFTQDKTWQQLSKPKRQRNFGDGHELDGFDDLATSAQAEARYMRQPTTGSKAQLRSKMYQNILPDRTTTPSPSLSSPYSPARADFTPRFARDTAASRIARETSLAQRAPSNGPLAPLTTQRVAQLSTRTNFNTVHGSGTTRSPKKATKRPPQLKPYLISNLNPSKDSKVVKGMVYNPDTYRWEGNENALGAFDAPASSPSTASVPAYLVRDKENATPRPALITPIGATKGVQVVGGMVFDPQNMCWLKIGPPSSGKNDAGQDALDGFNALDDEDDVFKDIPDLEDTAAKSAEGGQGGRMSDIKDDWMVGEEFDVGPEFVRRQREEEAKWRKKCEQWLSPQPRDRDAWRWTIRDIVLGAQQ
ncbi:hypothetical protein MAPG_02511 [Magnaporthiopsis poae ATCC 64411]|uniref:Cytokinesis regulator n=1 Tax=Magnaporthiopsis poae (strain ATCC 64411 / 73-15) TaxID=644358 RepID=A0A0C4DRK0_MAGP6|nr:hypothetical protein MAPG_02511 [Magnaporthiopsis poae ATCC 64411]